MENGKKMTQDQDQWINDTAKAQEEYDREYERLAQEEAKTEKDGGAATAKEGITTDDAALAAEETEKKAAEEQEQRRTEAEEKKLADQKSKDHGSIESLEKALNDTKSYAGKLAMEKAELEKKLKEYEAGTATKKEVDDQKKAAEEAQDDLDKIKNAVYEDYPELKMILDPLLEQNKALKKTVEEIKTGQEKKSAEDVAKEAAKAALDDFNENVKPKIIEKHADFDKIVKSEAYWQWAEAQRPALKFAAMNSPDPEDIIMAVTEFKKSAYAEKIETFKSEQEDKKKQLINNAQTLRGGSSSFPHSGKKNNDPNDYESGWKDADEQLKREGIRA